MYDLSQIKLTNSGSYNELHKLIDWTLEQSSSTIVAQICWIHFKMVRFQHFDRIEKYEESISSSSNNGNEIHSSSSFSSISTISLSPVNLALDQIETNLPIGLIQYGNYVFESTDHMEYEQHAICNLIFYLLCWDAKRVSSLTNKN